MGKNNRSSRPNYHKLQNKINRPQRNYMNKFKNSIPEVQNIPMINENVMKQNPMDIQAMVTHHANNLIKPGINGLLNAGI